MDHQLTFKKFLSYMVIWCAIFSGIMLVANLVLPRATIEANTFCVRGEQRANCADRPRLTFPRF